MKVRYIGLAQVLSGVEEDAIPDTLNSLKEVITLLTAMGRGFIEKALAANGYTPVGQMMIEMDGKSIDLREVRNVSVNDSTELSVMIIPTVVGG